jgi:hypothetical protein
MAYSGMLRRVALVRTDVSVELSYSIIKVTRIGELGTTIAITTNYARFEVFTAVTMKNAIIWDVTLCSSCMNRCFGGT